MPDFTQHQMPDAVALLEQLRSGQSTARQLVESHLQRLKHVNPGLNAAIEVLEAEALEEADAPLPGELSGLPISLKETYALAGRQVTIGSMRMPPIDCADDAPVVKRLKAAGAIVIARSNVPEFVMTPETNNLRFGRTNHPKDQRLVPGGSTGGEGALVASGASPIGFGTDILGSIRIPAVLCGLVGFRPHSGAIDKTAVYPESGAFFESWNGLGPICRSVRDARLAYSVIANQPPAAPATVAGLRLIAPVDYPFEAKSSCIDSAYQAGLQGLQQTGMVLTEPEFNDVESLFLKTPKLVTGEMVPIWKEWLSSGGKPFSVIGETLRQATGRPSVQPGFFLWLSAVNAIYRPRNAAELASVIEDFEQARVHYRALIGSDGVLCLPTLGMLAPKHGAMTRASLMKPGVNKQVTAHVLANMLDLSAITVPAPAFADAKTGLVPGVMLAAAPGHEGMLLDVAAELEQVLI